MERNEQKKMDNARKENGFTNLLNYIFRKKPWVGNIAVFLVIIVANAYSATIGGSISFFNLLCITFFVTLFVYAFLAPVLAIPYVKGLRGLVIDEDIEKKNMELSEKLCTITNNLQESTAICHESIGKNEKYFDMSIKHMGDCRKINNIVRKSYMIKNVDEYYQHLKKARENADGKDVYLTHFSTKHYIIDNKNRDEYYSTNIDFIKHTRCDVYRIVTVHTQEKLEFLQKLVNDAKKSEAANYYLAYLNIERFSDENGDMLPGIVGMDIIENEVIIMDFRYARALKKNDIFENPLYIESEEIADMCRAYYKEIWDEISEETPASRRRYKGYVLYNGALRKPHEDIDTIWKEIESKIPVKN